MNDLSLKAKQWGHWTFARYCAKRSIPFEFSTNLYRI